MNKRTGTIQISFTLIETKPNIAQLILSYMIVLRAEAIYHKKCIEYVAVSDLFREVKTGERPPYYHVAISDTGDVQFVEQKEGALH